MAVTQSSALANYGYGGGQIHQAVYKTGRALPISGSFVGQYLVDRGYPSARLSIWGAAINAAAFSESSEVAGAISVTTIPTVSAVDITPSGYAASLGVSDVGHYRTSADNDPIEHMKKELEYALSRYLVIDSSVGVTYQYTQASASGTNSGLPLTRSAILEAANTVWNATQSYGCPLVCVIEGKGRNDLSKEMLANGGGAYANVAMSDEVKELVRDNPFLNENNYLTTLNGNIFVFVEPDPTALQTSGGDYIGAVFVPANGVVGDTMGIAPGIAIAYAPPMTASRNTTVEPVVEVDSEVGPLVFAKRSYNGQGQQIMDGRGYGASAIVSQSSICKMPYSQTA